MVNIACKTFTLTMVLVPTIGILAHYLHTFLNGDDYDGNNNNNCRSFLTPPPTDYGTGSMFDKIATRYDFINHVIALNLDSGWRKIMVEEVTDAGALFEKQNAKVLDLATGTADVAILLGKEAEKHNAVSSSSVLGVDPSNNMIEVGRSKVSNQNLSDIVTLELGDARKLETLSDNSFDAVTMAFGIRNVPEKVDALCEIHRVMKKEVVKKGISSKLCILEFSEPKGDTMMGLGAKLFIKYVVPVWGAILSGAPKEYMHLQNSIKHFPEPEQFKEIMEGLECGKKGKGMFRVEDVKHLNFGSVQLYVATPVSRK